MISVLWHSSAHRGLAGLSLRARPGIPAEGGLFLLPGIKPGAPVRALSCDVLENRCRPCRPEGGAR